MHRSRFLDVVSRLLHRSTARWRDSHTHRASAVAISFVLISTAVLIELDQSPASARRSAGIWDSASDPWLTAKPGDSEAQPTQAPADSKRVIAAAPPPPPPPPMSDLTVYKGLGVWIDLFDFAKPGTPSVAHYLDRMKEEGVRTLYLQTGRWNMAEGIARIDHVNEFIEGAHARGMYVVGWYLPGFANIERDVARSMEVYNHVTPNGHRFDGFAPDIEDLREVGKIPALFDAGVAEYSRRLRASVPPGTILGAIVPDAKNNERAPGTWGGFPWAEIGAHYDVVLPMAYWTVTKRGPCHPQVWDAMAYMREVHAKTAGPMGKPLPFHMIGGIADCMNSSEMTAFAQTAIDDGWYGVSLYDMLTTEQHPERRHFWSELRRANAALMAR